MITGDTNFHVTSENYRKYADDQIIKALETGRITDDDASLITEFISELKATASISAGRAYKLQYLIVGWRAFLPPFKEVNTKAAHLGIEKIKTAKGEDGSPLYKTVTQSDYIKTLKRFLTWMEENDHGNPDLNLAKLKKIKSPGYRSLKTAEQILTPDEIKRLIEATTNTRDRCFVSLLYESGCRIGELGVMKWNQVKFTDVNVVLNTAEKTGKGRFIPIFMAVEYLKRWYDDYPGGTPGPDDHVFVNLNSRDPLVYRTYAYMLERTAKAAGIEKAFTPHTLRHSRITHLLKAGYSESTIKKVSWGSLSSNMLANYAHLTDDDIESEYCERLGILKVDRKVESSSLEPRQCPACMSLCSPMSNFCNKCGSPLTEAARVEKDEAIKRIMADETLRTALTDLLKQRGV
jgi:site-specific recombinase XerD